MRIIADISEFPQVSTAVAIGKFDGVHLGHRKLISIMTETAAAKGLVSVVFTFDPPPAVLFGGLDSEEWMLVTRKHQREIFETLGVDILVEFPFTRESAATEPEDFIREILVGKLHAAMIFSGGDVSFGAGGRGDLKLLQSMGEELGYSVSVIEKLSADGEPISSTRIRKALREGRTEEARALLGD